jgi:hypothetical protein
LGNALFEKLKNRHSEKLAKKIIKVKPLKKLKMVLNEKLRFLKIKNALKMAGSKQISFSVLINQGLLFFGPYGFLVSLLASFQVMLIYKKP